MKRLLWAWVVMGMLPVVCRAGADQPVDATLFDGDVTPGRNPNADLMQTISATSKEMKGKRARMKQEDAQRKEAEAALAKRKKEEAARQARAAGATLQDSDWALIKGTDQEPLEDWKHIVTHIFL